MLSGEGKLEAGVGSAQTLSGDRVGGERGQIWQGFGGGNSKRGVLGMP